MHNLFQLQAFSAWWFSTPLTIQGTPWLFRRLFRGRVPSPAINVHSRLYRWNTSVPCVTQAQAFFHSPEWERCSVLQTSLLFCSSELRHVHLGKIQISFTLLTTLNPWPDWTSPRGTSVVFCFRLQGFRDEIMDRHCRCWCSLWTRYLMSQEFIYRLTFFQGLCSRLPLLRTILLDMAISVSVSVILP